MPSPSDIKAGLAAAAHKATGDTHRAQAGAAPPGGPQGVFDVSNDGTTWHPAVRLRASTGTAFVVNNGEVLITGESAGMTEYADFAALRASPPPTGGTVARVVTPPGEYRYSSASGAGFADNGATVGTIIKPTSVDVGSNGRWFSTAASATCPTFDAMRGLKDGSQKHVHLQAHTTFGDGGGGLFDTQDIGSYIDDGGRVAVAGSYAYVRRVKPTTVNVADFGAASTASRAANRQAFEKALAVLLVFGGGTIEVPDVTLELEPAAADRACVHVSFGDVRIKGLGRKSTLRVFGDSVVPVHVSTEADLDIVPSGTVDGFEISNVRIVGTGNYTNYALAYGRGVLLRNVINASIHDNWIEGMSMIGACTEHSCGNIAVYSNHFDGCCYSAVNFNGRAYNSSVSGNTISGTVGDVNSCAIQVDGPCSVTGNTIFGDVTNYAISGGILWGEGNWDGQGLIVGNVIYHCRFGIKTIYHGSVIIENNTIVCCRGGGGVQLLGGVTGGFTVSCSHQIVGSNLLINNYPVQLEIGASNSTVHGNIVRFISSPVNPSGATQPDAIVGTIPEVGIRVVPGYGAATVDVTGNHIDGAIRGITYAPWLVNGSFANNTLSNCTYRYSQETGLSWKYTDIPDIECRNTALGQVDDLVSTAATPPSQGYFRQGSSWRTLAPGFGSLRAVVSSSRLDTTNGTASAGGTSIVITGAADFAPNSVFGITLDDGTMLWTKVASASGNTVNFTTAIPVGRSVAAAARVYNITWIVSATIEADLIARGASVALSSDASTALLAATLSGLRPSSTYTATVGARVTIWKDGTLTDSGSCDLVSDVYITTDASAVATVTLQGYAATDYSRFPAGLATAVVSLAASAGGFTISATRVAGVASHARATYWVNGLELIG